MRLQVMRLCLHIEVSIHASVKDATKANALAVRAIMVSIHASVKDATQDAALYMYNKKFQSTHL